MYRYKSVTGSAHCTRRLQDLFVSGRLSLTHKQMVTSTRMTSNQVNIRRLSMHCFIAVILHLSCLFNLHVFWLPSPLHPVLSWTLSRAGRWIYAFPCFHEAAVHVPVAFVPG